MVAKCFGLTTIRYGGSILANEIRDEHYVSLVCLAAGLKESFLKESFLVL